MAGFYDVRESGRPITIYDDGVSITTNVESIDFAGERTVSVIGNAVTDDVGTFSDTYLKLDQTSVQTVENGMPLFKDGLSIGNTGSYLTLSDSAIQLFVNSIKKEQWYEESVFTGGDYMGFGSLTYS